MDPRSGQTATTARANRPLLWAALLGLALVAGALGGKWYLTRPARQAAISQRMTNEGYAQWQKGDFSRAEVSLQSAAEISPANLRPRLLLGRMWLSTPQRERGRELFARLLSDRSDPRHPSIAANYHDALVCVGWWEELARLTVGELAFAPDGHPLWLDSALTALRLARLDGASAEHIPGWDRLGPRASGLLHAQIALNEGDPARALACLAKVPRPFTPLLSLSKARLHLRAGDRSGASSALAMTATPLTEVEVMVGEILVQRHDHEQLHGTIDALLANPATLRDAPVNAELILGILSSVPDREIADKISAVFTGSAKTCGDSLVTALLIYCSLSGAERSAAFWGRVIEQRAGVAPLKLKAGQIDQRSALFVINSFPLTRDFIVALLDAVEAAPLADAGKAAK